MVGTDSKRLLLFSISVNFISAYSIHYGHNRNNFLCSTVVWYGVLPNFLLFMHDIFIDLLLIGYSVDGT